MRPKLLLATNNKGKLREYKNLLRDVPYELVTPAQQSIRVAVEEVGESMEENARLKAVTFATRSQLLSLADDSGLEVDILGGEPGRFSAQFDRLCPRCANSCHPDILPPCHHSC